MEYELKLFLSFKIKTVKLVNGGAHENHSLVVNSSNFQQLHLSVPLDLPLHAGKWQSISALSKRHWLHGYVGWEETHILSVHR